MAVEKAGGGGEGVEREEGVGGMVGGGGVGGGGGATHLRFVTREPPRSVLSSYTGFGLGERIYIH